MSELVTAPAADAPATEDAPEGAGSPKPDAVTDLIKSTFEVAVTLADQQADPNSPLFSAKTFEELGLHQDLLKGIYDMGFSKPSKIQERALPLLLSNPEAPCCHDAFSCVATARESLVAVARRAMRAAYEHPRP
ncbi:hypothetical protein VTO73DRAFT_9259 [Trametes versicolor]